MLRLRSIIAILIFATHLVTHHGEGFSRAALAVGQNTGVESLEGNIEHFDADFFKNLQAEIWIAQASENFKHTGVKNMLQSLKDKERVYKLGGTN